MKRNIYLDFSYLLLISATLGAVLVLGAFVAPVIFHSDAILSNMLIDRYNEGLIMTEIFHRFTYWLYAVSIYVIVYEAIMYKNGQRDIVLFGSSVGVIFTALMFSSVYAPKIIQMQALGAEATKSDTFANIHLASEIDFKILALCLAVLFVRRLMLMKI